VLRIKRLRAVFTQVKEEFLTRRRSGL